MASTPASDGFDEYRANQLRGMDDYRLAECASWGRLNAPNTAETKFANELLASRRAEQVQS